MRAPETVFFRRELERSGAPRVTVSSVFGDAVDLASADVAFGRQNGAMHVNECAACAPPPNVVTVTVRHALTGKTKAVVLNRLTGRVSIQ
jgi:hypothetical protein